MGKQYRGIIKNSWRELKKEVFGLDLMEEFHATDANLKSLSDEKLSRVTSFFVESSFVRIGMFVDKQFISNLDDRFSWNKIVHAVAGALSRQIGFAGGEPAEKDRWIIELSDKLSRDLEICQINNATSYFLYHRAKQHLGHSYMKKKRCEPGLEMADLILYVDRLVRLRELPPTPSWQELVHAMFCPPAKTANGWAIMEGGPVLYNPSTGSHTAAQSYGFG